MLTAIGRAAARRVLLPSRTAASNFTRLSNGSVAYRPNASSMFVAARRHLTVSAWMRQPTKATGASKTKKTTSATKKKTTAAKKKPKKAAVTKKAKKPKKELTPEEKEKADLRELKKMALLKGPVLRPDSVWSVYVSDNVRAGEGKLTDRIKEIASTFAGLSEAEKERLKSTALSNQNANKETREKWVKSYPVGAIYMANIARRRIARKLNKSRIYLIHDDRLPKRAGTPYTLFIKSRFSQANSQSASGTAKDTFRAMSEEWRAMSESEKQPFQEAAAVEVEKSKAQLKELKEKARAYWREQGGGSSQVPS